MNWSIQQNKASLNLGAGSFNSITAAQRLAREDGVSLNQWIAVAVAEKIGAVETAADFLRRKAGDKRPLDLLYFLDRAGNETPPPGDEIH